MSAPDDATIRAARDGDREAVAALLRSHAAVVYAAVRRIAFAERVDDLCREIFALAAGRVASVEAEDRARAWILGIAHRRLVEESQRDSSNDLEALPPVFEGAATEPLLRLELSQAMEFAIRTLPAAHRRAFVFAVVLGQPVGALAEGEGVPEETLQSRVSRARASLCLRLAPLLAAAPGAETHFTETDLDQVSRLTAGGLSPAQESELQARLGDRVRDARALLDALDRAARSLPLPPLSAKRVDAWVGPAIGRSAPPVAWSALTQRRVAGVALLAAAVVFMILALRGEPGRSPAPPPPAAPQTTSPERIPSGNTATERKPTTIDEEFASWPREALIAEIRTLRARLRLAEDSRPTPPLPRPASQRDASVTGEDTLRK